MDPDNLVIGFMGDVMIGRGVNAILATRGYNYVWGDTLNLLRSTDLNIANLETTLTNSDHEVPKVFNFKASPDRVKCLTDANIQVVNLANNHILDFAEEGLKETLATLDSAQIQHTGAGINIDSASSPVIVNRKNISLAILGCTDNEPGWKATATKTGVNYVDVSNKKDREKILQYVEQLQKQNDFVIVSIHWGPNLKEFPEKQFIAFAHEMIDHGASVIHGHSAHNFQGIELYKQKLIFYDTGDFVDDYIVHADLKNDHCFFFMVAFSKYEIVKTKLVPVLISNYQANLASDENKNWSIKRIRQLSAKFGTTITEQGEVLIAKQKEAIKNNNP